MSRPEKVIYEFGPFRFDSAQHLLFRKGEVISLAPKAVETLVVLVENHGQLVEKEDLMKAVWPDTFVEEANLTVHISALRKVFQDEANGGSSYIETVPRRGYRFVAPVLERPCGEHEARAREAPRPAPPRARSYLSPLRLTIAVLCALALLSVGLVIVRKRDHLFGLAPPPIRSVAVLPLQNLSGDNAQDYLADGLTEALVTDLAQIHSLRVISRTSVMSYKGTQKKLPDIAKELNVDAVVEGSLTRSGDQVQVYAQLIEAREDAHLWAQTYQGNVRDILTLQSRIAQAVVKGVGAVLTPDEKLRLTTVRLVSPDSHDAYMQGRFYWNKRTPDNLLKALDLFDSATRLDPNSAEAYAALGTAYMSMLGSDQFPPREMEAKSRSAAEKALSLDDTIAEPHAVFAMLKAVQDYDWKTSDAEFERAEELDPSYVVAHHWHAFMLSSRGRNDEAYVEIQKAYQLDPRNPGEATAVAFVLYWARKYDDCIAAANKALQLAPDYFFALNARGECYEQLRRYDDSLADYQHALRASPHNNGGLGRLGHLYGVLGRTAEAQAQLADIQSRTAKSPYVPVWQEALICIGLGERERALDLLEQDQELRTTGSLMLRDDAIFDPLRSEPRFVALLKFAHLED
jgi:TolB-like protein/DNA-binding winged helix-turn-helix (wHTH) protein/Flp pilus assembly protein TadD